MTPFPKYLRLAAFLAVASFLSAQAPDTAATKFEFADVHVSPKVAGQQFMRITPPRNSRYEIRTASLVDLIRQAYGFDTDKILGGPTWLEMEHFDVIAKVANDTSADTLKLMLQSLLTDRFALKLHKDTQSLPTYALIAGKKPQLKQADGSGDTGCKIQTSNAAPVEGGIRIMMNGGPVTLGPGQLIQYECRNMTMESFAAGLRNMLGASVGNNPVLDKTGLEGKWNFDVKWSLQFNAGPASAANTAPPVTVFDAVEKQLGLKLEQQSVATPVLMVDSASQKPTANPPGVAEALPEIPIPKEFEVVDLKPSAPDSTNSSSRSQNGRFTSQGTSLSTLLRIAFISPGAGLMNTEFVGMPGFADKDRYDVTAKIPAGAPSDLFSIGPMIRSMLEDRFKLKLHTEERPQSAYSLVASKPKMKKADPSSRTNCKFPSPPPGSARGTQLMTCQNITMAQFADQLRSRGPGLNWPILDSTSLDGGWDFTLTYNNNSLNVGPGRGAEGGAAPAEVGSAADPDGGFTIFEAVEKQLGLRLEMQKRPEPVVVIDHLEEKPTDN